MATASNKRTSLLQPGQIFDRYTTKRLLGHGGMGEVWLVRHNILQVDRALKLLFPDVAVMDSTQIERFLREAKLACRIKHPNLIEVHDAGYSEISAADGRQVGVYYIFMDYVSGGSLGERLRKKGLPPIAETLSIVRQVASALETVEANQMVHRDIKPDNIMFTADGAIKLADLGIAKSYQEQDETLTATAAVFGTPAYMAPEQAHDASRVDIRADIYSLGCVAFEMLTGRRPYQGRTALELLAQVVTDKEIPDVREIAPDIPPSVASLVADLCRKDRDLRIRHPAEVVRRIDAIQTALFGKTTEEMPTVTEPTLESPSITGPTLVSPSPSITGPTLASPFPDSSHKPATKTQAIGRQNRFPWSWAVAAVALLLLVITTIHSCFQGRNSGKNIEAGDMPASPEIVEPAKITEPPQPLAIEPTKVYGLYTDLELKKERIEKIANATQDFQEYKAKFQKMLKAGTSAKNDKDYATAYNFFVQADSAADWLIKNGPMREQAVLAREKMDAARKSAEEKSVAASQWASSDFKKAEKAGQQAAQSFQNGDFAAADKQWLEAEGLYQTARTKAISAHTANLTTRAGKAKDWHNWSSLRKLAEEMQDLDPGTASQWQQDADKGELDDRIKHLLREAEAAQLRRDWKTCLVKAGEILKLAPDHEQGRNLKEQAEGALKP